MINLKRFATDLVENPVSVREFRMRMRGGRAYLVMFGYVLILSLVLFLTYFGVYSFSMATGNIPQDFGDTMFRTLVGFQIAMIGLVVPGLTAWLISIEKEQQTFELLVSTLLTPTQIIVGKLLPAVSFLALLLATSLPLATFCLVFGGLSPTRVIAGYLGLLMFGMVLACIGIICSTLFKKSFAATVAAYVASGTVFVFPFFGFGIAASAGFGPLAGNNMWAGAAMLVGFFSGVLPDEFLTSKLLNMDVPTIALNVVINFVFALLLTSMATANLPHYKVDRGPAIRLLLLIYSFLVMIAMVGGSYGSTGGLLTDITPMQLSVVFGIITTLAALAAPQLTATPLNKGENKVPLSILKKLNPRTWLQTDGGSGLWFSLVWALSLAGVSLMIMGALAKGYPGMALTAGILFVLLGATTFMYGCFGIMLYAMTMQTASARALAFVFTALHWAVTSIMVEMLRTNWFGPAPAQSDKITFVHYVWPLAPFAELIRPNSNSGQLFGFYFFIVNLVLGFIMLQVASAYFKKAEKKRLDTLPAPVFKEPVQS